MVKFSFFKASFYYEVKFSKDFNFVKGGKIPGFYGGKMGCNGGADAAKEGCFSSNNYNVSGKSESIIFKLILLRK